MDRYWERPARSGFDGRIWIPYLREKERKLLMSYKTLNGGGFFRISLMLEFGQEFFLL